MNSLLTILLCVACQSKDEIQSKGSSINYVRTKGEGGGGDRAPYIFLLRITCKQRGRGSK